MKRAYGTYRTRWCALLHVYKAYIALEKYDVVKADEIIAYCVINHPEDCDYLFEAAQYYARRCNYKKALELYERSWEAKKAPRYTDALQGIATIYKILGDKKRAAETYDKILECLMKDWGYSKDDKPYIETERDKAEALE